MSRLAVALHILYLVFFLPAHAVEKNHSLEFEEFAAATENLPHAARAGMLVRKYYSIYPKLDFGNYGAEALRARFDTANVVAFYSHDESISSEIEEMYQILSKLGISNSEDRDAAIGAQIISRRFDRVGKISRLGLTGKAFEIPQIDPNGVSDLDRWQILSIKGEILRREVIGVDKGDFVIVVASPLCAFSRAASKAIQNDVMMSRFFSRQGIWLMPPMRRLYLDRVASWNVSNQDQEMVWAYKASNWPVIDNWSTPVFYFIRNGAVVEKITGWPKNGGNIPALRSAIRRFTAQH